MNKAEEKLCIDITHCKNTGNIGKNVINPCEDILKAQNCKDGFLMPEPWSGHLSDAKILFIGSNPSFDCNEVYLDSTWSSKQICVFFENRFKNGKIQKKTKKEVSVPYWTYLIKYINWINEVFISKGKKTLTSYPITKQKKNMYDGLNNDVASTEIVHCKSKGGKGFVEARCKCSDMWMADILNLFHGKLIVVLGDNAKDAIDCCCKLNAIFASQKVPVIYLPHPNFPMSDNDRKKAVQSELRKVGLI